MQKVWYNHNGFLEFDKIISVVLYYSWPSGQGFMWRIPIHKHSDLQGEKSCRSFFVYQHCAQQNDHLLAVKQMRKNNDSGVIQKEERLSGVLHLCDGSGV